MKRIIFFFVVSTVIMNAIGQNQKYIDSLQNELRKNKDDTNKVRNSMIIADEYVWSQPDTALYYAKQSLALAEKLNDTIGQIFNLGTLSYIYSMRRNDSLALSTIFRSIHLSENRSMSFKGYSLYDIAIVYYNIGDYPRAINYSHQLQKALPAKSNIYVLVENIIGKSFYQLKEFDSAKHHLERAMENLNSKKLAINVPLIFMGHIHRIKGDYMHAMENYRKGIGSGLNDDLTLKDALEGYEGLAQTFKLIGQRDSALWYSKKAFTLATTNSFPAQSLDACILLKDLYIEAGSIDSAFKYQGLTLSLKDSLFNQERIRAGQNLNFDEFQRQAAIKTAIEKAKEQYQNRVKIYALLAGLVVSLFIAVLLFRNNRQKQKANIVLQEQKQKVEAMLAQLKSTQTQLIQSEKMASLGELTAGIAHEIQNPLNFVNNFSEVNKELIEELKIKNEKFKNDDSDEQELLDDIFQNNEKITFHGKRADAIVKGMLQHSRASTGQKEPTDINALADEYLRLSFHGLRAKDKTFNVTLQTDFDESIGKINIARQDIGRVLLNLYNNAFYAVTEKKKQHPEGYEPTVSVITKKINDKVEIRVKDNGNGISQKVIDKIFQPFFTTKPTGQGTGLGLSLSYDIIKVHGGEIKVETKEGKGAEFIIQLFQKP
jgi:signal transduction histidine kinase